MKVNSCFFSVFLSGSLLIAGGCATTIKFTSLPDNADVTISTRPNPSDPWVPVAQLKTPASYTVQNHQQFFGSSSQARIDVLFQKDGFADHSIRPFIIKWKENRVPVVNLEPLNTFIEIITYPEGASVTFHRNKVEATRRIRPLPVPFAETLNISLDAEAGAQGQVDFRKVLERSTPFRVQCSAALALKYLSDIEYVRIELPGFVPLIEPLEIVPGVSKSMERRLTPAQVNLNIRSRPPGAVVEDWRPAGFGKLGETDLERQITYDELARRPEFLNQGRLVINLRAFKEGYGEWTRDNIEIPLGDTYELEFHLPPRQSAIRIDSEPAGASVYVLRTKHSTDLGDRDATTGAIREVEFKRHMGTTPFTYTINAADSSALRHGDEVFFERQGYESTKVIFVRGATVLHGKLDPQRPAER